MRSKKQLLKIVLKNLPILRDDTIVGICDVVDDLHNMEVFSDEELDSVNEVLNNHLPPAIYQWGFCWHEDDLQGRVSWLKEQIEKH